MCRQIIEKQNKTSMTSDLLTKAARELENMKQLEKCQTHKKTTYKDHIPFPPACLCLLKTIPGNIFCVDCGATNPQWATLTYGALLCLNCSGKQRRLGVQLSVVRSITMDSWSHKDVLAMLEGGNKQLSDFFDRHGLSLPSASLGNNHDQNRGWGQVVDRYHTNAAMFYRKNLSLHVKHVQELGEYKGRDWSRRMTRRKKAKRSTERKNVEDKRLDYKTIISNSVGGRLVRAL